MFGNGGLTDVLYYLLLRFLNSQKDTLLLNYMVGNLPDLHLRIEKLYSNKNVVSFKLNSKTVGKN